FLCLALTGATDTVSMVIRNVIRHLHTPDSLRGRMTSVNMIFFMGGPQLGELEAGVVAQLSGAAVSGVGGGLGCPAAPARGGRRHGLRGRAGVGRAARARAGGLPARRSSGGSGSAGGLGPPPHIALGARGGAARSPARHRPLASFEGPAMNAPRTASVLLAL